MLDFQTGSQIDCTGVSRRSFLRIGALASLGVTLPDYLRVRAETATPAGGTRRPKNCILLWMQGGPSHIDTLDPKPDAPVEVRGEFSTIATTLPGVRISEHLPGIARIAHDVNIIRGHDPKNGSHGVADHLMLSGHKFNASLAFPTFGSVVAKERGFVNGMLPFVQLGKSIDRRFNGGIAGFLGDTYNPFEIGGDPSSPAFKVQDLSLVSEAEAVRLQRRVAMLQDLDRYQKAVEVSVDSVQARDTFYEKAHGLVTSPIAKKAFDLSQESLKTRERYGRNSLGQSCLLARRLIESGVQFVTIADGGWDTHTNNFKSLKDRLLPRLDTGYSALIEDLKIRGMLDDTLVVWFGDFGRTPKVNPSAGRDHWASAGVALMAGGGLASGQVVGKTNALAEFVTDDPVSPQDLAATIYHSLGIPLHTWYKTQDGRPIELVPEGKPIRQLVG
ncbi:DUF1501 domain-containing protein [Tuwongella immobilis]|uniref:DUF1501 domain-containing protein n=1 Tax=Tuwongella immobilis TaxID=692036 RepID=A0A6C2YN84_9BACT|nr:DUF1501 domain-containing protein [Tuwongella immobilis]VIP02525.1 hypothetical protein : Uncharacterized protein OS=Singulisphaera acidiphila (strain ATCC BAA-1392 / DSM 18658 / VKM B-2454 / MOB10) GN=Sinac_3304 PE=4 SV=1: DUF1501 [Tuwongella immobilis]VTS01664.1 hypothetical protein : Uncharacterized protein OS=Singulisphaera acidiphila (strain ATCC BAA-1392 / DSM 18658 / VKM B-2454 / MOB10) GN=Sinac_3304 PE=4 SV=1: DUF1501 [Tuwongella immobilis]